MKMIKSGKVSYKKEFYEFPINLACRRATKISPMRPQTGHVYTIFLERIKAKNHTNLVRLPPSISSLERGSQNPFRVHSCPRISDFAVCCTQLFQHLDDSELFMIGLLLILLHFEIILLQNSIHFLDKDSQFWPFCAFGCHSLYVFAISIVTLV